MPRDVYAKVLNSVDDSRYDAAKDATTALECLGLL
jgi:hypothetical protein